MTATLVPDVAARRDHRAVLDGLVARRAPARGTGHDRTHRLCERLGLDPTIVPTVHVTGTNGKTSTARMVDHLLGAAGLSTMRFTSPHLHHVGERVAVDGVAVDDLTVARRWHRIAPAIDEVEADGTRLSFFDVLTAVFLDLAAELRPDVAVVEVGRGGRDDATNVCAADVAVFTPVGGDHPELGATPTALARTKLGIVTHGGRGDPGPRLVSARQVPGVAGLLARTACARGLSLRTVDPASAPRATPTGRGQRVELEASPGRRLRFDLPARGAHQADNAALALAAAEAFLGQPLDTATARSGFATSTTPGRLDQRRVGDVVVRLDGAHNPAAAMALARALPKRSGLPPVGRRVLVLGTARGKDLAGMLAALGPVVDEVVATTLGSPEPARLVELATAITERGLAGVVEADPAAALALALDRAGPVGDVLVTGSLHLVGALRHHPALVDMTPLTRRRGVRGAHEGPMDLPVGAVRV